MELNDILESSISWAVAVYDGKLKSIIDSLIANLIWEIPTAFIVFLATKYSYKQYKKIVQDVGNQTHISMEVSRIIFKKNKYKVEEIPDALLKYRDKLNIEAKANDNVWFWKTRISTFILFTDGKRVLLFNRKGNKHKETIHNPKMDAYGAMAFHNPSLKCKLSNNFLLSPVEYMVNIPGIAIEDVEVSLEIFKKIKWTKENVVMLGFIAYVNPENLNKALISEIENKSCKENLNPNMMSIVPLSFICISDKNLTAKAQIAIKYLFSLENKIDVNYEEDCKKYCGRKPFVYINEACIKKDDLKEIIGIGIEIEKMLYKLGIYKFEQIANWTDDNIEWIQEYLYFPERVKRERWVEQARKMEKNYDS